MLELWSAMKSAADNLSPQLAGMRVIRQNATGPHSGSGLAPGGRIGLDENRSQFSRDAHPRILLTDTDRRPYAARLALVLAEAGCDVFAICSRRGHPMLKTRSVRRTFSYNPF